MAKRKGRKIPENMLVDSGETYTDQHGNVISIQKVDNEVYYQHRGKKDDADSGLGVFFDNSNEYYGWKKFNDLDLGA